MKLLLKYLKNYKKESILAPLFKLLEASFELIVPLIVASIIDIGIKNNNKSYIVSRCIILILLGLVGMISAITAQYFAAKAATGFSTEIRHDLFVKIQSLTFSDYDSVGTATLITRITNDINQLQTGVNMILRLMLRSPFIVFGAMVMAFTIDVKIALVFVVTIAVLSVIVFGIMGNTIPKYKNVQKNLDEVLNTTKENLDGARVIRAFCNEDNEIGKFRITNNKLANKQKNVGLVSALTNPLTYLVINFGIILLIYFGGVRVNNGALLTGQVVALYSYMSQILVELIKFANFIVTVTKAFASGARVDKIFEINSSLINEDNGETSSHFVEFKNVSLKYTGNSDCSVEDISFTAEKGQVIGIIGGTGSGKSTVVNLISHFYDATSGAVFVDGKNVNSYDADDLRNKIGMVFQKAVLFKGSIKDNLLWGNNKASDEDLAESVIKSQAVDVIKSKGTNDFEINQGGRNLSGGQKQRLSIARALVKKPQILVLDDSFSALDYATESKLRKEVSNLEYKPTVFIVSQRTASIMNADKILVMDDGKLVGQGTHNELLNTCEIYEEIYSSQFKKEGE